MKDGMGWDDEFTSRAGIPQYPCLIDQKHITGELYEFINVPMVVWIDEKGRVVRPAEPAGRGRRHRSRDGSQDLSDSEARDRRRQAAAPRILSMRSGTGSQRATAASSCFLKRKRAGELLGPNDTDALAMANFRLGEYLFEKGHRDEALKFFAEARRLRPESWSFKRQTWELEQAGKAAGPEFFAEVMELGDKHYYAPLKMKGSAK